MYRSVLILALCVSIFGCYEIQPPSDQKFPSYAKNTIRRAIDYQGGALDSANVAFVFRDHNYEGSWNGGDFRFGRMAVQGDSTITDYLTSKAFERRINKAIVQVPDSMVPRYSASVNSVWYFAMLPFRLLDPAVQETFLDSVEIRGKGYDKIRVTFREDGGGEDFQDVFVYWFDQEDASMDYLAYSYAEEGGVGLRFREAINPRRVGGILFQDYVNYRADPARFEVEQLDSAFLTDALDILSMVELEEVEVY